MKLTRRSLFASAAALLALPKKAAAERLLAAPSVNVRDFGAGVGPDDTTAFRAAMAATGAVLVTRAVLVHIANGAVTWEHISASDLYLDPR